MNRIAFLVAPVLLAGGVQPAHAQSISRAWDAYRKGQQPTTAQPQAQVQPAAQDGTPAPSAATAQAQSAPVRAPTPYVPPPPYQYRATKKPQGGFFVGVQAGKGWVYEDVDQDAVSVNAGYRWQAGAVSLIGIELASGRLSDRVDGNWFFPAVRYGSVGANARFNFGEGNPWFAIARLGYWAADYDGDDLGDVDGGYAGFGLGVDVSRNFNVSLLYTNYVYATSYYYGSYYQGTEVNRADMVTLGVEARF